MQRFVHSLFCATSVNSTVVGVMLVLDGTIHVSVYVFIPSKKVDNKKCCEHIFSNMPIFLHYSTILNPSYLVFGNSQV